MLCVGDIHGDLNQLIYPLIYYMNKREEFEKIIYIGDYTSRGFNDIYIYEIITKLMIHDEIIFLAGNHDVQKYYSPNLNAEMSSFFDFKFNSIGLKTNYLWAQNNPIKKDILFTHCRCNIPLNRLDTITYDNIRCDRLYDRSKPPESSYFNIYGHEHHYGGDEYKFCVDDDSSFIYDVMKNGVKLENSSSKVSFCTVIDPLNIFHITQRVQFGDKNDYNSKPFSFIANLLDDLFGLKHNFSLNDSFNIFKEEYSKSFKNDPSFKNVFHNLKQIWNGIDTWGTYGNVPYEFFYDLGLVDSHYKNIIELRNLIKSS